MNPNQPSTSMYDDLYQSQDTPDPLDEFLSQLLDAPDVPPTSIATSETTSAPAPAPASSSTPDLTCRWVTWHDPLVICGSPLSSDPKHACTHLRLAHNIRGNDKATIDCLWHACRAAPMQRGSVIRHILAVHLGLLRWQCDVCGRMFSRKGTGHLCEGGAAA